MKRATVTLVTVVLLVGVWVGAVALAQEPQQRRGFSVQLVEPLNQQIILGKTKLRAEVKIADPELVDRVEFVVGDEVVFVDREPPYECFHDFGEEPRSWIVKAVAWHKEDISISDAVITRKVKFASFTRVNRVLLWISVTDDDGFLLTDLDQNDFRVFEDGAPQKILEFYPETRPILSGGAMSGR